MVGTALRRPRAVLALALGLLFADRAAAEQADAGVGNVPAVLPAEGGDVPEARRWLRRAAEQGHAEAQMTLGAMSMEGRGVPRDDAEAARWLRRAAEQGHAEAQLVLGLMYVEGRGVSRDYVQAHKWFDLAATSGDAGVRERAVTARKRVEAGMSPSQIAEARELARGWRPRTEVAEGVVEGGAAPPPR